MSAPLTADLVRRLLIIAPDQDAATLTYLIDEMKDKIAIVERCSLPRHALDKGPLRQALAAALDTMGVPQ